MSGCSAGEEMMLTFDMQLEEALVPKYRGLQVRPRSGLPPCCCASASALLLHISPAMDARHQPASS